MRKYLLSAIALLSLGAVAPLTAQTPSDAIMMKQKELCFALIYDHGSWNQYWEGTYLRSNQTVATLTRKMVMPMVAIGIMDQLNLFVGMPFVKTESSEPNGGRFQGVQGFQDLNIAVKYEMLKKQLGKGKLAVLATGGYATPITNYLSDYRPYSIGNGTNELSVRGISEYKLDKGPYARVAVAYLFRGQTKAERDYYYNNGSYYTPWMDVPDAWEINGVAGIWMLDNSLKVEVNYYGLKSTSGDDVRPYNAPQPTNKVQFDQVGFLGQYYVKKVKGLGVLAYYNQVVNGRNWGKFSSFGVGGTYQFKI
ncbi:MAG: transporter [Cyclobacteriaceae bacterium]|nr:transporter [Cyclobacteriaceae bacterium]